MRESTKDRAAWTEFITGEKQKTNKYGAERKNGYASKREHTTAVKLHTLARVGKVRNLREQVNVVLVEGRDGVRGIVWRADFVYEDEDGKTHYIDSKGAQTPVYKLKKRLAFLLKGIVIEED